MTHNTSEEEYVTVVECQSMADARTVRALLEKSSIPSREPNEVPLKQIADNVHTYGFIPIQVPSRYSNAAKQIISASLKFEMPTDEPDINLADAPLSRGMKAAIFCLPMITIPSLLFIILIYRAYSAQGCRRKAAQALRWFAGGITFWVLLLIFIFNR